MPLLPSQYVFPPKSENQWLSMKEKGKSPGMCTVSLGKTLNLSEPAFLICKVGLTSPLK